MNGNSLGLSKETLERRQRKNVVTLYGQCFSFAIELFATIFITAMIHFNISVGGPGIRAFFSLLLVFSYFLASPELKRFYYKE